MKSAVSLPEGTQDRLFEECQERRRVQNALTGLFQSQGYREVSTPEVEFYDLFIQSGSPLPQEQLLKIVDRSGRILVMRPDCTTPIARMAAAKLKDLSQPQKLYYDQTVFRSAHHHRGSRGEIAQCGVELLGAQGLEADAQVLTLAADSLEAAGLSRFHIEIGHMGFFRELTDALGLSRRETETLRDLMEAKNYAAFTDQLTPYQDRAPGRALYRLPYLFGGAEVLDEAQALFPETTVIPYLRSLYERLTQAGDARRFRFDLGLVHQIDYYTGVIFRGYTHGAGAAVLSGGRYDNLLASFGADAPATGFACDVDAICGCLRETPADLEQSGGGRRLKIALTKGRLQDKCVELFERMGLDCEPVKHPGRRLVHALPNYPLDAVLAKAPDVITYVEHGVCDLGIVGKDTILEQGSSFYEVLDLGMGKCRFALAVKKGTDFYGTYKTRRVASKYPEVTRAFFEKKGMDISIIKIEGSVELAPILNLADAIVDIVETGATLRENGLEPIEDVQQVSARLIVNTASMKLYKDEIMAFIEKCRANLGG